MKKLFFGLLSSLLILTSCHKDEEKVLPGGEEALYEVDFDFSGIKIKDDNLKSVPIDTDGDVNRNLNVVLHCINQADITKTFDFNFLIPYKEMANKNRKITICLPSGSYDVHAIASNDIYDVENNTTGSFKINWKLLQVENQSATSSTKKDEFWYGSMIDDKNTTGQNEGLVVNANTTGTISLGRNFSIIEWRISNFKDITGIKTTSQVVSKWDVIFANREFDKTQNEYAEITHDWPVPTSDDVVTYKIFTFPGKFKDGETFDQKITFNVSNGNSTTESRTAKIPTIKNCKRYTLTVSAASLNITLEENGFVDEEIDVWE